MNKNILNMKPSGIRRFTALARATPGCKMLTIGEPDFDTPEAIRAAAAEAMEMGLTHYAPCELPSRNTKPNGAWRAPWKTFSSPWVPPGP